MSLSFTPVDWLVLIVVVISAGYAVWRGFLLESLTIFAWLATLFACLYAGPYAVAVVEGFVKQVWLAKLLGYAIVLLLVFVPLSFVSRRLSEAVKRSAIGALDRLAGLGFGVARGLVIAALGYLAFTYFVPIPRQPHWLTHARLLPAVKTTSKALLTMIPAEYGHLAAIFDEEGANQPLFDAQSHDGVAELIRRQSDLADTQSSSGHKSALKVTKSYGAGQRQALDRLVETGGSDKP